MPPPTSIEAPPFFSVVIPIYNRAHCLERCLNSVLNQTFKSYEIILVDDASTDASVDVASRYVAANVSLIRHPANMGVCPARNSGAAKARGEWIIFLDSDDELPTDGALAVAYSRASAAPREVGSLLFRCQLDDGRISPAGIDAPRKLDFHGYLAFIHETTGMLRDMLHVVRKECAEKIKYPTDRMLEDKYHLDFSAAYAKILYPDILRLYHQDSGNQLVNLIGRANSKIDDQFIKDRLRGLDNLILEYGQALKISAPNTYEKYLYDLTTYALLAGLEISALKTAISLVRLAPLKKKSWVSLAFCLIGPRIFQTIWNAKPKRA